MCEGFLGQAAATSVGLGMPNLPVAMIPGHAGSQGPEELRENVRSVTARMVMDNLLNQPEEKQIAAEPTSREIVFSGSFEDVNDYFYEREWSDGLPIVPPTIEKVKEFLSFTDRDPDESLGILLPENRAATIWAIAVNGVMAGCKPEYMPILVALVEAMADPIYGVEHSGNTPGADTLITLNGPIIKQLGFNYTQGVLRDGFKPNTSVGRFWRLALRNMCGFLLHKNDKGTFGNTFRVVLAENEDALAGIGWPPHSVDMGFAAGDNTVTISRHTGVNAALYLRWGGQAERLGDHLHCRVVGAGHAAPGAGTQPDSGADHRPRRLDEGGCEAVSLRPRPHSGLEGGGLYRDLDGSPHRLAQAAGDAGADSKGVL